MSREVWQGDVLNYIRKEIPKTTNGDFLELYKSINNGSELASSRISDIRNAEKNKKHGHIGRDEFAGQEELFYNYFFKNQDSDVAYNKLRLFMEEQQIHFPDASRLPEDTNETYILRFLKYGLANTYAPEPGRAFLHVTSEQENSVRGGGVAAEPDPSVYEVTNNQGIDERTDCHIDQVGSRKMHVFIERNWFMLFLAVFLAFSLTLFMTYAGTELTDIYLMVITMPAPYFMILIILLAVLPKAIGIAQAYVVYVRYRKKNRESGNFVNVAKYGTADAVVPGKGVFDSGTVNLQYGLISNMTGAMCAAALYVFLSRVEGITNFIRSHPVNECLFLMILTSIGICLVWDFRLQTRSVPQKPDELEENPDNYLLDRLHVPATMIHMIFSITFVMTTILYLYWFGFVSRHLAMPLDISFVFIIAASFLFFWFSSTSPHARNLKVDCTWLIHLIPLSTLLTLIYAIWFYAWSGVTALSILASIFSIWGWFSAVRK